MLSFNISLREVCRVVFLMNDDKSFSPSCTASGSVRRMGSVRASVQFMPYPV